MDALAAPGGAAPERTALAWTRSALSIVAIAASVVKAAVEAGLEAVGIAAALVLLAIAGVVWVIGSREPVDGRPSPDRRGRMLLLAAAPVLSGAVAFAVAIVS